MLVSAHPGLVLRGEERATFARGEYCLHCETKSTEHVDNVRAVLKADPHNEVAIELLAYMTT
jgi:hypothetical protein